MVHVIYSLEERECCEYFFTVGEGGCWFYSLERGKALNIYPLLVREGTSYLVPV
jgi:hypothetical protein